MTKKDFFELLDNTNFDFVKEVVLTDKWNTFNSCHFGVILRDYNGSYQSDVYLVRNKTTRTLEKRNAIKDKYQNWLNEYTSKNNIINCPTTHQAYYISIIIKNGLIQKTIERREVFHYGRDYYEYNANGQNFKVPAFDNVNEYNLGVFHNSFYVWTFELDKGQKMLVKSAKKAFETQKVLSTNIQNNIQKSNFNFETDDT